MNKIAMFVPYISESSVQRVTEVLRSKWIGEGPRVAEFERCLTSKFGFKYAVALNSGTAGLRLALALAGVGPGDEVITTAQTCTATNMAILEQGAHLIFADIQYYTGNLDHADVRRRVTDKTRAILCVHWAGYPCDLEELHEIARERNLPVIEDAAHALGATYHGQPIGAISQFTMFSFQAIKQLTTGDGGLLTVLTEEHNQAARRRRWFGIDRQHRTPTPDGYWHWPQTEVGYKYHMNDIAASIGLGNLEEVDDLLRRRSEIVARYQHALDSAPGVTLFERRDDRTCGNWLFTLHVERRHDFIRALDARGIEASIVHIRNDVHPIFGGRRCDLPTLDRYEHTHVSLPLHNHLTDEDVERVIEAVKAGW